jgi:hypothetical protein
VVVAQEQLKLYLHVCTFLALTARSLGQVRQFWDVEPLFDRGGEAGL